MCGEKLWMEKDEVFKKAKARRENYMECFWELFLH